MTLVDTNVLLDVTTDDPIWADWSIAQLETASLAEPLVINDAIYAELGVRYKRIEQLDNFVVDAGLQLTAMPRAALFLAGKVFDRRAGGVRAGVLPDFFIGAHAAVGQHPLLTREVARYRTYFPTVMLICPSP